MSSVKAHNGVNRISKLDTVQSLENRKVIDFCFQDIDLKYLGSKWYSLRTDWKFIDSVEINFAINSIYKIHTTKNN